ncbi:hypothetical protein PS1_029668 [Malus domestica]
MPKLSTGSSLLSSYHSILDLNCSVTCVSHSYSINGRIMCNIDKLGFGIHFLDVCRRNDRPEREEGISGIILGKQDDIDRVDSSDCDDNDVGDKELAKPLEPSHVYLSNAEVQINSGRIPIWQKSKDVTGGEMEIETVPVHEVEMRQKDLLPVVHPFHRFQSDWNGRFLIGAGCSSSSSDSHEDKEKFQEKSW